MSEAGKNGRVEVSIPLEELGNEEVEERIEQAAQTMLALYRNGLRLQPEGKHLAESGIEYKDLKTGETFRIMVTKLN